MFTRSTTRSHRLLSSVLLAASVWLPATAPGQIIFERAKLLAADGADGDWFGRSLAAGDGLVVIGAPFHTVDGIVNIGSAYLFELDTGLPRFELFPSPIGSVFRFGTAVAIDGGIVAVSGFGRVNNPSRYGSVRLFDAGTGRQLRELFASGPAIPSSFGVSIDMSDGLIAVGAPYDDTNGQDTGTVYVFDVQTGELIHRLFSSEATRDGHYGYQIAIDDTLVVVGATQDLVEGIHAGAVYVFDAHTGEQINRFTPEDPQLVTRFGRAVAIENGIVAISASHEQESQPAPSLVVLYDARTGQLINRIFPDQRADAGSFTGALALSDGILAVGAAGERTNGHRGAGAVYIFEAATGRRIGKLHASDAALNDHLGYRVAMSGGRVAASAPTDRIGETWNGSAYVFDLTCRADLDENGRLDVSDLENFFNLLILNNPRADFAFDGILDFFDVQAYLDLYAAGCP